MATDEYVDFCVGVRKLAGVDLSSYKRAQMERRIRSHAQRNATPDLRDFLRRLESSSEWLESFLDRITINVSELYRNRSSTRPCARRSCPNCAAAGP